MYFWGISVNLLVMIRLIFVLLIYVLSAQSQVVSEVVGSINNDVITSRDVRLDWYVESVLYRSQKSKKIYSLSQEVTSQEFNQELNRYLMESVVYREAKLFKIVELKDEDLKSNISKFKEKLGEHPEVNDEWRRLSASPSELQNIVSRKLQSKSFMEFKAKSSLISVTEAEIFNYYKNNRKKFGTKPFKDFKDSIKNFLSKQQSDQRLSEWFGVLKKKYQVKKVYIK